MAGYQFSGHYIIIVMLLLYCIMIAGALSGRQTEYCNRTAHARETFGKILLVSKLTVMGHFTI
jgi:hypothetical protein